MLVIAETCIIIFGIGESSLPNDIASSDSLLCVTALANWVDLGLIYGLGGPNAWRVGLALQGFFPLVVFALIGLIPESPRSGFIIYFRWTPADQCMTQMARESWSL